MTLCKEMLVFELQSQEVPSTESTHDGPVVVAMHTLTHTTFPSLRLSVIMHEPLSLFTHELTHPPTLLEQVLCMTVPGCE